LPAAPEKLYNATKEVIDKLKLYRTEEVYKEEYNRIIENWEKVKELYQSKYYKSAKKELEKLYPEAKKLLEKIETYREKLEKDAWEKYNALVKKVKPLLSKKKGEERLKIELYLWKLRTLITMEKYDEFYKEIKNFPF
jgi:phosphoglycerate-specific signal transduction histidine kinase